MKTFKRIAVEDTLVLLPGQLVSVVADKGVTIQLSCGRVWITIEGEPDDHWLSAGDTLSVPKDKHVLIEADKIFSRVDVLAQQSRQSPARAIWPTLSDNRDFPHKAMASLALAKIWKLLARAS